MFVIVVENLTINFMKILYLFLLLAIVNVTTFSQIVFEKGYYIDSEGQKLDCLIKNEDWSSSPTEFEYKISEFSETQNIGIDKVKEFGIETLGRFIRFTVNLDTSSVDIRSLSKQRNPEYTQKKMFLKVLVEGSADLFLYDMGSSKKYFYRVNTTNEPKVEQLIYKKYEKYTIDELEKKEIKVFENNYFRQQLFLNLKCEDVKESALKTLSYSKKSLTKLFLKYNLCKNSNYTVIIKEQKRDLINLGFRVGVSRSRFSLINDDDYYGYVDFEPGWVKFDAKWNIRLGLEFEVLLPINKNKWGLFIEPTFHTYKSEADGENHLHKPNEVAKIEYNSIEVPFGLRHYFFLNDKSKLFVNGAIVIDYNEGSKITFEKSRTINLVLRHNFAIGLGYNYNDDFIFEFRWHTFRKPISPIDYWGSRYSLFSFIVGYSLF